MGRGFRIPTVAIAAALLALLAVLATLQYRWLGQISDAERDRMTATLNARASGFAQDFDQELTRAYMLFQIDAGGGEDSLAADVARRYQQWQATARFPGLIQQIFVVDADASSRSLREFDPASGAMTVADWPRALDPIRAQVSQRRVTASPGRGTQMFVMRTIGPPVWPSVPAIVVPLPVVFTGKPGAATDVPAEPDVSYAVLVLDRDTIARKVLPALAEQHFTAGGDGIDYELAVVSDDAGVLYHSAPDFLPSPHTKVDATTDLFAVRPQFFGLVASEISRFAQFTKQVTPDGHASRTTVHASVGVVRDGAPLTFFVQTGGRGVADKLAQALDPDRFAGTSSAPASHWHLLVKHPAGSLEIAVAQARHRNLAISSGIFAVLAISIGLLVVSTRRAQTLARQQLEFVATVSHELRTPLAVIRSAGDNLAEGMIGEGKKVREYGALVRREGLRLSDLVEQVLQFAGLESAQRPLDVHPVDLRALMAEAAATCTQAMADPRVRIETDIPGDLPPVRGDEAALRRVFQNLIGNAIKYGGDDGWVGIRAARDADRIVVTVSDHGIGIAGAEHARVFEPFYRARSVISAQIPGAGLGLSLVKRIVSAHGGAVALQSAPGQGSSFTVTLIAATDPATAVNGGAERMSQATL